MADLYLAMASVLLGAFDGEGGVKTNLHNSRHVEAGMIVIIVFI